MTVPSPVNKTLAEAAVAAFFRNEDWHAVAYRHGWVFSMLRPLVVIVTMSAMEVEGNRDRFTLRLSCDYYPTHPPDAIFVNPDTLEYVHRKDNKHVPKLEADYCRTHLDYAYNPPYKYGPQLVCCSMTLGYYISKHSPTPDQAWVAGHHDLGSTLAAIHRALRSSHYKGRHQ